MNGADRAAPRCGVRVCGLAAPPSAAWREGDDLIATTVVDVVVFG